MTDLVAFQVKTHTEPLKESTNTVKENMSEMYKDVIDVKQLLSNHITDTNKKIDNLSEQILKPTREITNKKMENKIIFLNTLALWL